MYVKTVHLDVFAPAMRFEQLPGTREIDAELVLSLAGRGVLMGVGIYVGIDTNRYFGPQIQHGGDPLDLFELLLALHVERPNAAFEGSSNLLRGLAHSGENDATATTPSGFSARTWKIRPAL